MPPDKHQHWTQVFNKVVPDDNSGMIVFLKKNENLYTILKILCFFCITNQNMKQVIPGTAKL